MNIRLFCGSIAALSLMACSTPSPRQAAATPPTTVQASPRLLLVSIDGLRADALDRGLTPNIQRMSEAAIQGVRPSQWQVYDRNIALEDRVQTVLGWLSQTGPQAPRLATLYMENVDKAGHTYGPESAEYRQAIQRADAIVGLVLDGLDTRGLAADTNIVLVSDHGMAELPERHVLDTERMVNPTVAVATSVGQPVGFQARPGREREAEQALIGRHDHYQCWKRADLPPRWQNGQHPRTPPIVCEMDEGWDALTPDMLARHAHAYRGSHGYDNTLPSMRAVFVATGPPSRRAGPLRASTTWTSTRCSRGC